MLRFIKGGAVVVFVSLGICLLAGISTGQADAHENKDSGGERAYDHRTDTKKTISYDKEKVPAVENEFVVIAWNDLGIHCMDDDFSISSTLPPFQTLDLL